MDPNWAKACDDVLYPWLFWPCFPKKGISPNALMALCYFEKKRLDEKNNSVTRSLTRSLFCEKSLSIVTPYTGLCWPYSLFDMKDFVNSGSQVCKLPCFPNFKSQWTPIALSSWPNAVFTKLGSDHQVSQALQVHKYLLFCSFTSTEVLAFFLYKSTCFFHSTVNQVSYNTRPLTTPPGIQMLY